jgi:hypothetical protein
LGPMSPRRGHTAIPAPQGRKCSFLTKKDGHRPNGRAGLGFEEILVNRELGATWVGLDSNQRSLRQQIYSLPHLTALEPTHSRFHTGVGHEDRREGGNKSDRGESATVFPISGKVSSAQSLR